MVLTTSAMIWGSALVAIEKESLEMTLMMVSKLRKDTNGGDTETEF
jgi:hypothetical protein